MESKIAFLGLGLIGGSIARRLKAASPRPKSWHICGHVLN